MKRVPLVLSLYVAVALASLACDAPKKPPMTPDNEMFGDGGVDLTDLSAPAAPDAGKHR